MKYPMHSNWLSFRRISKHVYKVSDHLYNSVYTMDSTAAEFTKHLDGQTDPRRIDCTLTEEEVSSLLHALKKYDLIRTSRILESSFGSFLITLWIPKWSVLYRCCARCMNLLLLLFWLPTLIAGVLLFLKNLIRIGFGFSFFGEILGLVIGVILHELAHAFAGMACHARVFEFGIGIQKFLPCAYTLMDRSRCKRMERIQINSAGIEENFFLTGLFLLLCAAFPHRGAVFFSAAFSNYCLGSLNLLCLQGLDGLAILSELLGSNAEEFSENIWKIVRSRQKRRMLHRRGFIGYAWILTSYILAVVQIGLPLLILVNIGGIITWVI